MHRLLLRPAARYRKHPEAFPPAWTGTFSVPSGDGSGISVAQGLEGVDKMGVIFVRGRGTHLLPIGGGESEFQHLSVS